MSRITLRKIDVVATASATIPAIAFGWANSSTTRNPHFNAIHRDRQQHSQRFFASRTDSTAPSTYNVSVPDNKNATSSDLNDIASIWQRERQLVEEEGGLEGFAGKRLRKALHPDEEIEEDEESDEDNSDEGRSKRKKSHGPAPTTINRSISASGLDPSLKKYLQSKLKFSEFTQVQAEVIPLAKSGRDLIVRARTGTGKTFAYLLPIVDDLLKQKTPADFYDCQTLIVAPTRELVLQIYDQLKFLAPTLRITAIYGGTAYTAQENSLKNGSDVVIATPGRLIDHMARKSVSLKQTKQLVLDEADEMLRLGFLEDVETILREMPSREQILLFSATMPNWLHEIAKKFLNEPLYIDHVGDDIASERVPATIHHYALCSPTERHERATLIGQIIGHRYKGRVLIFCPTKQDVSELAAHPAISLPTTAMHGDMTQAKRETIVQDFRRGSYKVLIATDIAARGLDIPEVEAVIHFEFPQEVDMFVHRAGRTGRAGKPGDSIILYTPTQRPFLKALGERLNIKIEPLYPPSVDDSASVQATVVKNAEYTINRYRRMAKSYIPVAEELIAKHGPHAMAAILASLFAGSFTRRSILTSLENFTAVIVLHRTRKLKHDEVLMRLQYLLQRGDFAIGKIDFFQGGTIVDIDSDAAFQLKELLESDPTITDVSIPTELPDDLFDPNKSKAAKELMDMWSKGLTRFAHRVPQTKYDDESIDENQSRSNRGNSPLAGPLQFTRSSPQGGAKWNSVSSKMRSPLGQGRRGKILEHKRKAESRR